MVRVGRAEALDEKSRMTLAANAHIRHKFADNDPTLSTNVASAHNLDAERIARENAYDQVQAMADSW